MVRRKKVVKIHAPIEFRDFLYEKKSEDSSKTLNEIMKEMASTGRRKKRKNDTFWGKI